MAGSTITARGLTTIPVRVVLALRPGDRMRYVDLAG